MRPSGVHARGQWSWMGLRHPGVWQMRKAVRSVAGWVVAVWWSDLGMERVAGGRQTGSQRRLVAGPMVPPGCDSGEGAHLVNLLERNTDWVTTCSAPFRESPWPLSPRASLEIRIFITVTVAELNKNLTVFFVCVVCGWEGRCVCVLYVMFVCCGLGGMLCLLCIGVLLRVSF